MMKRNNFQGFDSHRSCCAIVAFRENNCKIEFPRGRSQWICLSGTKYQSQHKLQRRLCDLLFVWNRSSTEHVSFVLELKGGGISVSGVVQQLQEGAHIVESLLPDPPTRRFRPVLVHRGLSAIQVNELRKNKILYRGKKYDIGLMRCGERIEALV